MKNHKIDKKGFTLIELMVSIAIVAILTALIIVNIASSRMKARDAKRVSDIGQLQLALEQYFTKNGVYPTLNQYSTLVPTYISAFPKDPLTNSTADYVYAPDGNNNYDYILSIDLEKATNEGLSTTRYGIDCDPDGTLYNNGFIYCVGSK